MVENEWEVNESAIFWEGEWSSKVDRSHNLLAQGLSITTAQQMRLEQSCGGREGVTQEAIGTKKNLAKRQLRNHIAAPFFCCFCFVVFSPAPACGSATTADVCSLWPASAGPVTAPITILCTSARGTAASVRFSHPQHRRHPCSLAAAARSASASGATASDIPVSLPVAVRFDLGDSQLKRVYCPSKNG